MTRPVKVDGSEISSILDAAAAPKKASSKRVAELEKALGKPLPNETKKFLERAIPLEHPHAESPVDFFGALPDVGAWLEQVAKGREGVQHCVHHFLGLYPIGAQLQYGDQMYALAVLEPYWKKELGGVMYHDEREVGTWGGSISAFLLQELAKFHKEAGDGDGDPRDCFVFRNVSAKRAAPEAAKLPAPIAKAWNDHWRSRLDRYGRWWITSFLMGSDPRRILSNLPNEKIWSAEKRDVAAMHHQAMYWLIAHWLLGNDRELEEAVTVAKKNPSTLVQAVRAYVTKTPLSPKQKKQLDAVLAAVRLASR